MPLTQPPKQVRGIVTWVVGAAAVLVVISAAHSLEDFYYNIPEERFNLSIPVAAALLGMAYGLHAILIAMSARDHPIGHLGNLFFGILWLGAATFDHIGEILFVDPYRFGLISKAYEVALIVSSLALAAIAFIAWRGYSKSA